MNGDTALPPVTFEDGADYDTLHWLLTDRCVKVWTRGVVLTALWKGPSTRPGLFDYTDLMVWSIRAEDYCIPLSIPTDDVTKVSVI